MTGATTTVTKRSATIWIVAGLIVGLTLAVALSAYQGARADGHATGTEAIVLSHTEVDFVAGTSRSPEEVWIRGSGFTPGREVVLLLDDSQGALYIISNCRWDNEGNCDPARYRDGGGSVWPLIANDDGAFATKWRIGRFTRPNVGYTKPPEGEYVSGNEERLSTLWAVDGETYDVLATAPMALCNLSGERPGPEGEEVPVPQFCSK